MNGFDLGALLPGSGWARLRRPAGLVDRTRWLFTVLAVVSVVLSLPGLVGSAALALGVVTGSACAGLIAVWVRRYLSGRAPVMTGAVEAVLVFAASVSAADPAGALPFLLASSWLRASYGSARGVVVQTALVAVAVVGALPVWGLLAGRDEPPTVAVLAVFSAVPVMFLTAGVARSLVSSSAARERCQHRDAAVVRLGNRLVGVTDRAEIHGRAGECVREICASTPGLGVLVVLVVEGAAVVIDHAGELLRVPRAVPLSVLPADPGPGVQRLPDSARLGEISGVTGTWLGVPFAERAEGWFLLHAAPQVPDEAVAAVLSMSNQVALTLRTSDAYLDLSSQASQDPLTGLANRAAFNAALDAGIAHPGRRLALLFLDLDDFKIVNDGLGHAAGDELLRHVAARLRAGVRSGDLCARIGGDEFAVLLGGSHLDNHDRGDRYRSGRDRSACGPGHSEPGADDPGVGDLGAGDPGEADPGDREDAAAVGQRLVELIGAPVSLSGHLTQVGASVGLAFAAGVGTSAEQLVHRADIAMYAAKAKGKNRVQVFDPSLLQDDGRVQFETELAAAAAADQLVMHYQPIMSGLDGSCVAVEALLRWRHPTRGMLHSAEFVPTAERTGAIVEIGTLALRRACADAASWSGPHGPLVVHVNVSGAQLHDPGLPQTVETSMGESGMPPHRLVLEIAENTMADTPAIALERLTAIGAAIAIDEFGTGTSMVSALRALPINSIKIDKSFLSARPVRAVDEAMIEGFVQIAGRLGIRVIAQGVKSAEQLHFLRSVGVDATQGRIHLRPVSGPEFISWLHHHTTTHTTGEAVPPHSPPCTG